MAVCPDAASRAAKLMEDVRTSLLLNHKSLFFSTLLYKFSYHYVDEIDGAPLWFAAVDIQNMRMYFNPTEFLNHPMPVLVSVLVHELKHAAYGHGWRRDPDRFPNAQLFNVAGDLIINEGNKADGYADIPSAIYLNTPPFAGLNIKLEDHTVETLYQLLAKECPDSEEHSMGDIVEGDAPADSAEAQTAQAKMESFVAEAVTAAKQAGEEFCDPTMRGFVEGYFDAKVPWQRLFRKAIQRPGTAKSTFSQFNRRACNMTLRIPNTYSVSTGEVHLYLDCSGSISQDLVNAVTHETNNLIRAVKPERTVVTCWGSSLHPPQTFKRRIDRINLVNAGGTNVDNVLEDVYSKRPKIAVIFTDGWVHKRHLEEAPVPTGTQVIWLIPDNAPKDFKPNYGTVIRSEEFDELCY